MPKVSVYLGKFNDIDYSDEVREEYDVPELTPEALAEMKKKFLNRFGRRWGDALKQAVISEFVKPQVQATTVARQRKPAGYLTVKIHRAGKKPLVVVQNYKVPSGRIIVTHVRIPPRGYSEEQDMFILRNAETKRKKGREKWQDVARAYSAIFGERRTAAALKNRWLRLKKRR